MALEHASVPTAELFEKMINKIPTQWQKEMVDQMLNGPGLRVPTGIGKSWTFPGKATGKFNSKWQRIEHKLCRMKYKNTKQWLYAYRWMRETHPTVVIQIYTSDTSKYGMIRELVMNPVVKGITLSDKMEEKVVRYFKLSVFSELG